MNKQEKGLFGKRLFGKQKQQPQQTKQGVDDQLNSISGRLRVLEERINNINRKIELDENNMLENQRKNNVEFRTINSEITEIKRSIESVKEKTEVITSELPNLASSDELDVLKKYIEMWEPLDFVTRDELEKELKKIKK